MTRDEVIKTIKKTAGNAIAFHRVFVKITGTVDAGLFLSQCLYWASKTENEEGWFYKTQKDWEDETGLSRREQERSRKILKALGLLEEKLAGNPARNYYRLNLELLRQMLAEENGRQSEAQTTLSAEDITLPEAQHEQPAEIQTSSMLEDCQSSTDEFGGKRQTSLAESAKQVWRKAPNKFGGSAQTIKGINIDYTETTTEITTEIKDCAEIFSARSPNSERKKINAGIDWVIGHETQPDGWIIESDLDAQKSAFTEMLITSGKNHLLDYAIAFMDATGIVPTKSDYRAWTRALEYLREKRATKEEVISAVNYAKKNGIIISSPFSIRNLVKAVGVQPPKTVITRY